MSSAAAPRRVRPGCHDAHVVRGGPNGRLSLEDARADYVRQGGTPLPHLPGRGGLLGRCGILGRPRCLQGARVLVWMCMPDRWWHVWTRSRVKTDAMDAEHPSTLLGLDAFTAVTWNRAATSLIGQPLSATSRATFRRARGVGAALAWDTRGPSWQSEPSASPAQPSKALPCTSNPRIADVQPTFPVTTFRRPRRPPVGGRWWRLLQSDARGQGAVMSTRSSYGTGRDSIGRCWMK